MNSTRNADTVPNEKEQHQTPSLMYRLRRGLSNPEYTFDYHDLQQKVVAWTTTENDIKQLTLRWFNA